MNTLTMKGTTMPQLATPATELSGDVFAALINLAGKRRFMSQRLVLYAVLASLGHEGAVDTARETLAQFQDAHARLMGEKGSLPGVFCEALRQAYFGDIQGDAHIRAFMRLADEALGAIAGNGLAAPALLAELVEQGTPILSLLGTLTLVYEEQAKRAALAERKTLVSTMAEMKQVSRRVRLAALDAQMVVARAGLRGADVAAATNALTTVTGELDALAERALATAR
ncbi:type IV pili methyl-accepting chemotaxis transducer N-terminal domain-containing protein [Massilia sp. TS11]|uniref:type IV pili methyl-accepting chemotaxis transducer N-terminal domain-containing protein n=1 Tax=Massilia sp. TS11 TaxID=2908003 RepID=UPI001ED9CD37|nr:type IV pili methyl-accepting chemotaxis transducer N-terminal domain-containing protein [Massilia sp. TS11]MCG2583221.1 type IV pili methyl-accepting chemotaxis transducer N-terminal domain-containing protein [Massilia sp. TS11]